jgi:hypothetical protein
MLSDNNKVVVIVAGSGTTSQPGNVFPVIEFFSNVCRPLLPGFAINRGRLKKKMATGLWIGVNDHDFQP